MAIVDAGATTYKEQVLTITVYKLEPECLNYSWHLDSKYQPNTPEHLEQLCLLEELISKMKTQSEHGCLHSYLTLSRNARREFAKEAAAKADPPADAVH